MSKLSRPTPEEFEAKRQAQLKADLDAGNPVPARANNLPQCNSHKDSGVGDGRSWNCGWQQEHIYGWKQKQGRHDSLRTDGTPQRSWNDGDEGVSRI